MTPLSQQLTDLAARARETEGRIAAARQQAREKVDAAREQARMSVNNGLARLQQGIEGARDSASATLTAFKSKVDADLRSAQTRFDEFRRDFSADRAVVRAEDLEFEAALAIDYAANAIYEAELAVLDAIAARQEADLKAQPTQPIPA